MLDGELQSTALDWHRIPERALLEVLPDASPDTVIIGNDGSFAALAEAVASGSADAENLVVLLLEHGLGGSAVVHGSLVAGYHRTAGWGHIPLNPKGRPCDCGLRGCAEQYFSITAIAEELSDAAILDSMHLEDYLDQLVTRARTGDALVMATLADARARLRELADVLVAAFDPDEVVLTGHGIALAEWVMPEAAGNTAVPIRRGRVGADAPIIGAGLTAQASVFDRLPGSRRNSGGPTH